MPGHPLGRVGCRGPVCQDPGPCCCVVMGRLVRSPPGVLTLRLLVLLTACSGSFRWGSGSWGSSSSSASNSSRAVSSTGAMSSGGSSAVSCSGDTCSVRLGGDGARAHVLGAVISFRGITDGRATLRVGGRDVVLTRGAEVTTGSLRLACTDVTQSTVSLTATRS